MNKRKAIIYTIIVLILGLILNFLFGIMPDGFKNSVAGFSGSIGLSYTLFWIICTLLTAAVMLFFVWKQTLNETTKEKDPVNIKRQINQYGNKSIYIEKNKADINIK